MTSHQLVSLQASYSPVGVEKLVPRRLRLLPRFADVLQEKIRTRTIFTKILANDTSEES